MKRSTKTSHAQNHTPRCADWVNRIPWTVPGSALTIAFACVRGVAFGAAGLGNRSRTNAATARKFCLMVAFVALVANESRAIIISKSEQWIPGSEPITSGLGYVSDPVNSWAGVGQVHPYQCTGSLIADDTVLTAAHCVIGLADDEVTFKLNNAAGGFDSFLSRKVTPHPEYSNETSANDIAVVRLAIPVPNATTYAIGTPGVGETVDLVGYGVSGNGFDGSDPENFGYGKKREGRNRIDAVTGIAGVAAGNYWDATDVNSGGGNSFFIPPHAILFDFDDHRTGTREIGPLRDGPLAIGGTYSVGQKEGHATSGDSGGPALRNGKIVGIVSFGFDTGICPMPDPSGDCLVPTIKDSQFGDINVYTAVAPFDDFLFPELKPGDADEDLDFDQSDLVQVLTAGKYLKDDLATWGEGDWNGGPGGMRGSPPGGDGRFNQLDIVSALASDIFLTGAYEREQSDGGSGVVAASLSAGGTRGDSQTSIVYDPRTGELAIDSPAGKELTSINIDSAALILTGHPAQNLGGSFDNVAGDNIFKASFGSSFTSLSFGNIAQTGLSEEFVLEDLSVFGSLAGGGGLGNVDLVYVPEPSTIVLAVFGLLGLSCYGCRRFSNSGS